MCSDHTAKARRRKKEFRYCKKSAGISTAGSLFTQE
jgi:hypothetical protein